MKKKILIFVVFLLAAGPRLLSQIEFNKWIFGMNVGLDFVTSPPTVFTNTSAFNSFGDAVTMSDNNGNLIFYTDGGTVFNKFHSIMANGSGIGPFDALCAGKQPGNNNLYYIFTSANNTWMKYSIIDMSLAAGAGSVVSMATNIYQPSCSKLLSIRHCNGKDVWIVSHSYGSNNFKSYILTDQGLSPTPVISSSGPSVLGNQSAGSGQMQASPDGKLISMAQYTSSTPSSSGLAGFYLFDFDPATGFVSNSRQLLQVNAALSTEFSSDGKKLYGLTGITSFIFDGSLYQWDLCSGTAPAIVASQYSINLGHYGANGLRRATDGKIYVSHTPTAIAANYSIGVINTPTASSSSINFFPLGLSVGAKMPGGALPNFINPYTKPVISFTPSQNCQHITFNGPVAPTIPGGCGINVYPINSYLWDFGEPSSGAANSSTAASPAHSYASTGTYSVKLIVYSNCTNDTIVQSIQVNNLAPTISVSGPSVICFGETRNYTVTGASSYSWSGSSSTNSVVALSPMASTLYSVTGSSNGCTATKTFSVKVNDCVGLPELARNKVLALYPNPFNDQLMVDMEEAMPYAIYSLDGKLVMRGQLVKGTNALNTEALKPGLYIAECGEVQNLVRFRVVKAE